jgi:hypothetical protein
VIVDALLWAPTKVVKYGLRRMTGLEGSFDDLALHTNQAIDDYIKQHPL